MTQFSDEPYPAASHDGLAWGGDEPPSPCRHVGAAVDVLLSPEASDSYFELAAAWPCERLDAAVDELRSFLSEFGDRR